MSGRGEITDEWLESLAFFCEDGYPSCVRLLRTNGHEIETWPRNIDGTGPRRWYVDGVSVFPVPETRGDVEWLLRRLRR